MSQLLADTEEYIQNLFRERLPNTYLYHDFNHTKGVVENVKEIGSYYNLKENELEALQLAAWFHDSGYIVSYKNHEEESVALASEYMDSKNIPPEQQQLVKELILVTKKDAEPANLLQEIMCDADLLSIGKKDFFAMGSALRTEWELVCDQKYSDEKWNEIQFDFLINTSFYTAYAREHYGPRRKKNISKQRKSLSDGKAEKNKSKRPGRGTETMYRSTYRNHINLSSIADNKANMMISINTIIMSLIITVLGSGFTFTGVELFKHLRFTLPITFLLITCLISAIFAILSARPNVTKSDLDLDDVKSNKSSILFFGNFVNLTLTKFLEGMQLLKEKDDLLYDNMSIDLYYLGVVLTRKYRLLRMSYNIFMMGLVVSVVVFLILFFLSYEKL